ncbi:MAG: beta-N-acetylhexosaminidase [Chitinophagaceae bacterium]|nr:beta-N-acetylhexosaminidase [Chitinophagaceae bacterium]MCW5928068.1 beta-N-acetylhexosaminidase [Chitinophagaceae bacterium]
MLHSTIFKNSDLLTIAREWIGPIPRRGASKWQPASLLLLSVFLFFIPVHSTADTTNSDLRVIPYPRQVSATGNDFVFTTHLSIVLDKNHSDADAFTAMELIRDLKKEFNIAAVVHKVPGTHSIILTRRKKIAQTGSQGYSLITDKNEIRIAANSEQGLFYGTQTLLQLIRKTGNGYKVAGINLVDWPDIRERAVHYDTKHHQDKLSYVKSFIKDLARYKINILLWEWEDKFAYPSHPEIGAPGAFTPDEIRELTRYARQYYIQLAPLVQGLGHSSFILKWPQFAHLREIPASNFEFCPLKDSAYHLLFDLWSDAMKATEGSQYIHIGSDETYELGACEQCRKKAEVIGKKGLYHLFSDKAARFILSKGRTPMIWETPMAWKLNNAGAIPVQPNKGLVLTEDDTDREKMIDNARAAKKMGYKVFFYDPNPGIEPLFLPYFFTITPQGKGIGSLEDSHQALTKAAMSGVYDGMVRTSWDDAGLHNQMWMLSFVTAAQYAWNGSAPELEQFKQDFFSSYYGQQSYQVEELFYLLNEAAYYYWETFERKVWHWGEIGKTFMPDLPRGDALEYDPYWNKQHKKMIEYSADMLRKADRALAIIDSNRLRGVRNDYDFDLFESVIRLVQHTAMTYADLSNVEYCIKEANRLTFIDKDSACNYLERAGKIVEHCLQRREEVFSGLVNVWEKTRLPKGMSLPGKAYFFQQDRTRHFANRLPDMTYLIYDEQKLDMVGWLEKLKSYIDNYKNQAFR